jgi:response regulator RpfG family c-di-GMP phosphodiesterase
VSDTPSTPHDLVDLAEAAADRLASTFDARPLLVQLWDDTETVSATRHGELAAQMHVTPVRTGDRQAGEIVLDGEPTADELTALERFAADLARALVDFDARQVARADADRTLEAVARLATRGLDPGGLRPKRGARIARELAEQLAQAGLAPRDPAWVDDLERAMTLRELGRCLLPSDLWNKPGKLTAAEYEMVRSLPDRAVALFDELLPDTGARWQDLARQVLLGQGERWDGSGYPVGRSGEDIPVAARVAAVVGAYDAMTRPRPYGVPRPHAAALSQLQQEAGTHFDPAVVRALAARGADVDRARAAHTFAPEDEGPSDDLRAA